MALSINGVNIRSTILGLDNNAPPPVGPLGGPNIAPPSNWSGLLSGFVPDIYTYSAGGETVSLVTAEIVDPLTALWNSTTPLAYDTDYTTVVPFFVLNSVITSVANIRIDANTDFSPPGLMLWDSAGDRILTTLDIYPSVIANLGDGRSVYNFELPSSTDISAIAFMGNYGYPQGRPRLTYGVSILV